MDKIILWLGGTFITVACTTLVLVIYSCINTVPLELKKFTNQFNTKNISVLKDKQKEFHSTLVNRLVLVDGVGIYEANKDATKTINKTLTKYGE